jgi:hypothetical protein
MTLCKRGSSHNPTLGNVKGWQRRQEETNESLSRPVHLLWHATQSSDFHTCCDAPDDSGTLLCHQFLPPPNTETAAIEKIPFLTHCTHGQPSCLSMQLPSALMICSAIHSANMTRRAGLIS